MRISPEAFASLDNELVSLTEEMKTRVDESAFTNYELARAAGVRLSEWDGLLQKGKWTIEEIAAVAYALEEDIFRAPTEPTGGEE